MSVQFFNSKSKAYLCFLVLVLVFFASDLAAQLSVPGFFSDSMVLQQQSTPHIWGKAAKNARVTVNTSWNDQTYTTFAGSDGRWNIRLVSVSAGGPYKVTIKSAAQKIEFKHVLLGEVWLCSGQSNMEMPVRGAMNQPVLNAQDMFMEAGNPQIRLYKVERTASGTLLEDCPGAWRGCSADVIKYFSAVGYLYAKLLQQKLNVPVGIIASYWGGSAVQPWMSPETLAEFGIASPQSLDTHKVPRRAAGALFKGMIAPLAGYEIKGFLWYQGESNVTQSDTYQQFFSAMVKGWREKWKNQNLPFYYVQIAPYEYNGADSLNAAFLREAQLKSLKTIANSGMAVLLDVGEKTCIHPADKYTVAKRLACLALSKTYQFAGIPSSGPEYKSHVVKNGKVHIMFNNAANGITAYYKPVKLFEVAGKDKVFYPAEALITKEEGITVWSDRVKDPVAVRYAFKNWAKGELYNNEGLPASSFRTDNW